MRVMRATLLLLFHSMEAISSISLLTIRPMLSYWSVCCENTNSGRESIRSVVAIQLFIIESLFRAIGESFAYAWLMNFFQMLATAKVVSCLGCLMNKTFFLLATSLVAIATQLHVLIMFHTTVYVLMPTVY